MGEITALKGVKVVDFGWLGIAPLVSKRLGILGATVIRVESHTRLDAIRLMQPFKDGVPHINKSPWFAHLNPSKYGVSLNLNTPKGLELAWKLIKWADVMLENFTSGTMKKWGLDYPSVRKVNPNIIYFSTNQMGQSGPYSRYGAFGYQSTALAGLTHLIGWPDRHPVGYQGAYTDYTGPRFGTAAILAALLYRRRTGEGQYIDQSQLESCVYGFLAPLMIDYIVNNKITNRDGNSHPGAAPHGVFPCKGEDRWCTIAVFIYQQWQSLCKAMGKEELTKDPKFSTILKRKANERELEAIIAEWTVNHTPEEVEKILQAVGVPSCIVSDIKDLREDPQLEHRHFWRKLRHPVMGYHTYRAPGYILSKCSDNHFAAPALGEHNEYVLKDILGLSDDDIADALIEGGISTEADLPEFRASI